MTKHIHIYLPARRVGRTKDAAIRPEDLQALKSAIQPVIAKMPWESYKAKGLSGQRWRWDLLAASKFNTSGLYKYLNDATIETALKQITGVRDATSKEDLERQLDAIQEKIEALEDKGVTVSSALKEERRKLQEQLKNTKDSVQSVEKEIANQQRLIDAVKKNGKDVPGEVLRRMAFLKDELAKAKAQVGDATNHLGEKEYRTFASWKLACRSANNSVTFEGDKDICQAKPGVGEWDGEKGVVYARTTKDGNYSNVPDPIKFETSSLEKMSVSELRKIAISWTIMNAHLNREGLIRALRQLNKK